MFLIKKNGAERRPSPRICMLSQRALHNNLFRTVGYEFEEVIREIDGVDLFAPLPKPFFELRKEIAIRSLRRLNLDVNPGIERIRLKRDYELFFTFCSNPGELIAVNAIEGWKDRCKTSVCWIEEVWLEEADKWPRYLKIMSKFDYVIINCSDSIAAVGENIGGKCLYTPPGIDTIRFCPYPNTPARSIDLLSIGRRSPVTHKFLLKMAENNRFFYVYDTINGMSDMKTICPFEHRNLIAGMAKRSRFFLVNYAKIDSRDETGGQAEIGHRFFEGAASGTVMIGTPPDTDAFREHFDWPDAVIKAPFNSPHIENILSGLDSEPERIEKIRENNIVQSLLRHDWAYRWKTVLDLAGLEERAAFDVRIKCLREIVNITKTMFQKGNADNENKEGEIIWKRRAR